MASPGGGGTLFSTTGRRPARRDWGTAMSESILTSSEVRTSALEERVIALEREVESLREDIRALAASLRPGA